MTMSHLRQQPLSRLSAWRWNRVLLFSVLILVHPVFSRLPNSPRSCHIQHFYIHRVKLTNLDCVAAMWTEQKRPGPTQNLLLAPPQATTVGTQLCPGLWQQGPSWPTSAFLPLSSPGPFTNLLLLKSASVPTDRKCEQGLPAQRRLWFSTCPASRINSFLIFFPGSDTDLPMRPSKSISTV